MDNFRPCDGAECDGGVSLESGSDAPPSPDASTSCTSSADCPSAQPVCNNAACTAVDHLATGSANHECAVMHDGSLWCWGSNLDGQLGRGSTGSLYPDPRVVATSIVSDPVTEAVVGNDYTCALTKKKEVRCWGDGPTAAGEVATSVVVNLPVNPSHLAGGATDACALLEDNSVYCWGTNSAGEIGGCATTDAGLVPITVSPLGAKQVFAATDDTTEVAVGAYVTCARTSINATVKCVGDNSWGGLGNGTKTPGNCQAWTIPSVGGNRNAAINSGDFSLCARDINGAHFCWGMNFDFYNAGILAPINGFADILTPTPLQGYDLDDVSIGWLHMCARDTSGAVTCWGDSEHGTTGVFGPHGQSSPPNLIAGLDAAQISAQRQFTCAIAKSGAVLCWGNNEFCTLARPKNNGMVTPQLVVWP